jgi:hypothetical protein
MVCGQGTSALGGNPAYPTSHDCPPSPAFNIGTVPIALALSSGTVSWTATTATNDTGVEANMPRVFTGYCRDSDDTLCFQGDPGVFCPPSSLGAQQCWENGMAVGAPCSGTFETCEQGSNGAFGPGGAGVRTITAMGTAMSVLGGPGAASLVGVFSVPPTFNQTVDLASDLPAPGVLAIAGTAQTCATANPCP